MEKIIKMVIANEASALKAHYDLTFHKTLAKIQVPKNDEKKRDLDKLCRIVIDIKTVVDSIFNMMQHSML